MYSYFNELCGALTWAGLLLAPLSLVLAWRRNLLRGFSPIIVLYLSLFSWAQAAFTEAYAAHQIIGYTASSRYTDMSGQGFFGGNMNDEWRDIPCQEPVYAHEDRGDTILWAGPLTAAILAFLYDRVHRTKYCRHILFCYLPFLYLAYSFAVPNTLPRPCEQAYGTIRR